MYLMNELIRLILELFGILCILYFILMLFNPYNYIHYQMIVLTLFIPNFNIHLMIMIFLIFNMILFKI